MNGDRETLERMIAIAKTASDFVKERYGGDVRAEYKSADDPVTAVDRGANELIVRALARDFPGVCVVAEESDPSTFDARKLASEAFFVDPIDGTRDFLAKNGEFAVMIGLARAGEAALGVIDCPALGRVFAGGRDVASFEAREGAARRALSPGSSGAVKRVAVSRSRFGERSRRMIESLGATAVPTGSAGLKIALVCAGEVDAYVHLERAGSLWDACPGDAIAKGCGVRVTTGQGGAFDYRRGDLDLTSGLLVAPTAVHAGLVTRASL